MTSSMGDVVWAYGRAYTKDTYYKDIDEKWVSFLPKSSCKTLKNLKEAEDFMWIVKNGKLMIFDSPSTTDEAEAIAKGYNEGYRDGHADGVRDATQPIPYKVYTLPAISTVGL